MAKIKVSWSFTTDPSIKADAPAKLLCGVYTKEGALVQAHSMPPGASEAEFDGIEPGDYLAQVVTTDANNEQLGATVGYNFSIPASEANTTTSDVPVIGASMPSGLTVQIIS